MKSASREARVSLGNPDVYVVTPRDWAPSATDETGGMTTRARELYRWLVQHD